MRQGEILRLIPRRFRGLATGIGLVALVVSAQLSPAGTSEGLSASEQEQLAQGEVIVKTRPVGGYPWPEVTVYRWVAASPEDVMAVYADFESQAQYLPDLVESRIVKRLSPNSLNISYEYEVTGPNERYTVMSTVSRTPGSLRVTWDLVTARYARRLSGHMKVEASDSGALIEYTNRVDPGFFGVRLGSAETTVSRVRETVEALAPHVERLRVEQQETLRGLTHALSAMLGEP